MKEIFQQLFLHSLLARIEFNKQQQIFTKIYFHWIKLNFYQRGKIRFPCCSRFSSPSKAFLMAGKISFEKSSMCSCVLRLFEFNFCLKTFFEISLFRLKFSGYFCQSGKAKKIILFVSAYLWNSRTCFKKIFRIISCKEKTDSIFFVFMKFLLSLAVKNHKLIIFCHSGKFSLSLSNIPKWIHDKIND